ncbi:hypothetical protein KY290_025353 [Solanum tuberosum]|uniref:Miraculin n=1 Tax=Solanum tuberosum TaxID=4113 RepID=A0ABQ7UUJ5_SOLTU|nr:hypothetical protein KY289_024432 [Solanum tuberosum]KAH0676280.1 hypothetical protein KY285_024081 [Solanum tuberosum]KAH0755083.1 hypothetical protein KY290_025353 [Solanum tuberosum]
MKCLVLFVSIALFVPLALSSTFSSDLLLPSELEEVVPNGKTYASVVDIDGNPVKAGAKYFVLPSLRGSGGGLILSRVVDKNVKVCPQDIVQVPKELNRGRPVEFFPAYPEKTGEFIKVNNPINVNFFFPNEASRCANFTVWKMDKKYKYVVGRGTLGALNRIRNWFRIVPYGKDYRFVYCPSLCVPCKIKCFDLFISYEERENVEVRRLAASGNELPFSVYFKKVD